VKRLGRIFLWLVFFPAGIWRSIRHGQAKDRKRLEKLIREQQSR
jgi:hypothetical protein